MLLRALFYRALVRDSSNDIDLLFPDVTTSLIRVHVWFRYVEVDIDEAMKRIERRHVLTGKSPEIAKFHVRDSAMSNIPWNIPEYSELLVAFQILASFC